MFLDTELRQDLARDLLDRRVRRVLHCDVVAAEQLVGLLQLPAALLEFRVAAAGTARLAHLGEARRPGSRYAELKQCRWELEQSDKLFRRDNIAVQNTTHTSIEEIASKILSQLGLSLIHI